jgi:hypothetical protein
MTSTGCFFTEQTSMMVVPLESFGEIDLIIDSK